MTGRPTDPRQRLVRVPDESEECARRRSRLQALRQQIAAGRSSVNPAIAGDHQQPEKAARPATRPARAVDALFDATGQDVGDVGQEV